MFSFIPHFLLPHSVSKLIINVVLYACYSSSILLISGGSCLNTDSAVICSFSLIVPFVRFVIWPGRHPTLPIHPLPPQREPNIKQEKKNPKVRDDVVESMRAILDELCEPLSVGRCCVTDDGQHPRHNSVQTTSWRRQRTRAGEQRPALKEKHPASCPTAQQDHVAGFILLLPRSVCG